MEDASQLVAQLAQTQREVSLKLAEVIIRRVLYRFESLRASFNCKRKDVEDKALIELRCFADAIRERVSSARAVNLVEKTFRNVKLARALDEKVFLKVNFGNKTSPAKQDANVLIAVIKHELNEHKDKKHWRINEKGIQAITSDYFILRDYNIGEHKTTFSGVVEVFGPEFLTKSEIKKYQKLEKSDATAAKEFLKDKASPKVLPIWYFTVSLCRLLYEGENGLTAEDAYWLGIIDEVIGTDMEGMRSVMEKMAAEEAAEKKKAETKPTSSSPTEPEPPS